MGILVSFLCLSCLNVVSQGECGFLSDIFKSSYASDHRQMICNLQMPSRWTTFMARRAPRQQTLSVRSPVWRPLSCVVSYETHLKTSGARRSSDDRLGVQDDPRFLGGFLTYPREDTCLQTFQTMRFLTKRILRRLELTDHLTTVSVLKTSKVVFAFTLRVHIHAHFIQGYSSSQSLFIFYMSTEIFDHTQSYTFLYTRGFQASLASISTPGYHVYITSKHIMHAHVYC